MDRYKKILLSILITIAFSLPSFIILQPKEAFATKYKISACLGEKGVCKKTSSGSLVEVEIETESNNNNNTN